MIKEKIETYLKNKIPVTVYDMTESTNKQAREHILKNGCDRAVFVANGQTAGRGRLGRSFYSPKDTGIYMTYVFKTDAELCDTVRVTTAAAVAVSRAIGKGNRIKWVNDIYLDGKKICGILTEAVSDKNKLTHIMVGIGINITTAVFPDDISGSAGALGSTDKDALVARICDGLSAIADNITSSDYLDYYKEHLLWKNEEIVYTENNKSHSAVIVDVDDLGGLIVEENGNKKILRSGEISVRVKRI